MFGLLISAITGFYTLKPKKKKKKNPVQIKAYIQIPTPEDVTGAAIYSTIVNKIVVKGLKMYF